MALENPSKGSIVEIITVFCVTAMHMPLLGIDLSVSKNSNVLIISKI